MSWQFLECYMSYWQRLNNFFGRKTTKQLKNQLVDEKIKTKKLAKKLDTFTGISSEKSLRTRRGILIAEIEDQRAMRNHMRTLKGDSTK